jgi:hypothetical protein
MSEEKQHLKAAIDELEQAKAAVAPLLASEPMLQLRVDTTLNRLISGLQQVSGGEVTPKGQIGGLKPLTSFFGRAIHGPKKTEVKQPTKDDVNDLREKAKAAYSTFLDREAVELKEALSESEIRAVAKLAGLGWVTSTKPGKVDVKFIQSIQEAIKEKAKLDQQKADEQTKDDRVEILKNLDFVYDPQAQTFTLGSLVFADADLLDDQQFENLEEIVSEAKKQADADAASKAANDQKAKQPTKDDVKK